MNLNFVSLPLANGDAAGIIDTLGRYPGALIIPFFAIVVIAVAAISITKMIIQHRERMAKIQMGIDPDAPPQTDQPKSLDNR